MKFLTEAVQVIKDWQTLIAGILAIIGAWATLRGVDRQIRHLKISEQQQRDRQLFASRAALPDALSQIAEYAESWIVAAYRLKRGVYNRIERADYPTLPDRPTEAIIDIKGALLGVDRSQAELLAELLAWFQVHEARLRSVRTHINSGNPDRIPHDRAVLAVVDAARLYGISVHLLPWSRRECIEIEPFNLGESTRSALRIAKIYPEGNEDVFDMVGVYERAAARLDP